MSHNVVEALEPRTLFSVIPAGMMVAQHAAHHSIIHHASTTAVPLVQDAYAANGEDSQGFNDATVQYYHQNPGYLHVKNPINAANHSRQTFLTFNLSKVSKTAIHTATVQLHGFLSDTELPSMTIGVYAVATTWNQTTLTWNTRPGLGQLLASFVITGTGLKTYSIVGSGTSALLTYLKNNAGHSQVSLGLAGLPNNSALANTSQYFLAEFYSSRAGDGPSLSIS